MPKTVSCNKSSCVPLICTTVGDLELLFVATVSMKASVGVCVAKEPLISFGMWNFILGEITVTKI